MVEHLVSIFGTEKDCVNCPFYFKIGDCRHGDRRSRLYTKPSISSTLLISNIYLRPNMITLGMDPQGQVVDPHKIQEHFKGGSGVGIGNFQEIGPLDIDLKPRNSTWLRVADLLFVDNPVGTGFSFVEDEAALVKTDGEAATDLSTLLKELFNRNETLQKSPLYIVAESYSGKFDITLGLSSHKAIKAGELKLKLGGVHFRILKSFKFGKLPVCTPSEEYAKTLVKGLVEGKQLSEVEAMAYIHDASARPL